MNTAQNILPKDQMTEKNLRRMYWDERLLQKEIAARFGVSTSLICSKMLQFRIESRSLRKGPNSPRWKGGKKFGGDKSKYAMLYRPDHPNQKGGYVYEHRLVAEQKLGRLLLPDEVVHHKDENPKNNAPDNLEVFSNNTAHLAETLRGKCPAWSADGWRRKQESNQRQAERAATIRTALEIYAQRHSVSVCHLTRVIPKEVRRLLRMELLQGNFECPLSSLTERASARQSKPIAQ